MSGKDEVQKIMKEQLEAEEVVFDQFGQWSHSWLVGLDEVFDEMPFSKIPKFAGLEFQVNRIWDEDKSDLLYGGEEPLGPADFRKWQPPAPDDPTWIPFSFSEDEDGPYVLYVRNKVGDVGQGRKQL